MIAATRRLVLVLGTLLCALAARADEAELELLDVALWPEFDRPAVLVMYRATAPEGASLPVTVRLTLPAAVGSPHAVAYRDPATDELMLADYSTQVDGEWQHLDITAPSRRIRLEYYAPLDTEADTRQHTWTWPGATSVEALTYEVQQPAGSSDLAITPAPTARTTGDEGLVYHRGTLGPVAAGEQASISIAYQRTDPRLSLQVLQQRDSPGGVAPLPDDEPPMAPTVPDVEATAGRSTSLLFYAVGGALLLVLVLILVWPTRR